MWMVVVVGGRMREIVMEGRLRETSGRPGPGPAGISRGNDVRWRGIIVGMGLDPAGAHKPLLWCKRMRLHCS